MIPTTMNSRIITLFLTLCLFVTSTFAQDPGALRRRMSERLPQLDEFKTAGVIGENNRGFVEIRGKGTPAAANLVTAENQDRTAVYALIAKSTGAKPEAVGMARARQIAANSGPGVWVQDADGRWARKK